MFAALLLSLAGFVPDCGDTAGYCVTPDDHHTVTTITVDGRVINRPGDTLTITVAGAMYHLPLY